MNRSATQSLVKNAGEGAVMILYNSNKPTIDLTREKCYHQKFRKQNLL